MKERMNERVSYVPFKALLGFIGTVTSKGMKQRMIVIWDMLVGSEATLASGLTFRDQLWYEPLHYGPTLS